MHKSGIFMQKINNKEIVFSKKRKKLKVADLIVKSATFFLSSIFYLNSFDVLILLAPI